MAIGYRNSVPLGQEGTGAATVLGPSRAAQYWLGVAQQDQNRLQRQQDMYQQTQQRNNLQFGKDINDILGNATSPLWASDFTKYSTDLMTKGGELRSRGINPYSTSINPENMEELQGWRGDANRLLNYKAQADQVKQWQDTQMQQVLKNPGAYRQSDIDAIRNIDKNYSFEDLVSGRVQPPQIQPKIDFQKEALDSKFNATMTVPQSVTDANGITTTVTTTRLNEPVARAFVDNTFRPGTPAAQEITGRLQDAGIEGTFDQLLGTTDRAELTSYIDGMLRSNDPGNPLTGLMAEGVVPNVDTPEYERFLNDAVDEQLKAERILEKAKNEALLGLQAGVKESDKVSYSNLIARERRAIENQARANRNSDAAYRNTTLSIQKKLRDLDNDEDTMIDEAVDIDFSEDYGDGATEEGIKVFGTIPLNTPSVSISPAEITSVRTGQKEKQPEVRGNITGVGIVAYDANGNVVQGNSPEELAKNPDVVRFAPQALVQDNRRRSYSYNTNNIPVSSLSKPMQSNLNRAINIGKKTADALNKELKKRPAKSQSTDSASWQQYNNGISNLFGSPTQTPTGGSRFSGVPEGGF